MAGGAEVIGEPDLGDQCCCDASLVSASETGDDEAADEDKDGQPEHELDEDGKGRPVDVHERSIGRIVRASNPWPLLYESV
jgi:hypothetical protein